MNKLMSVKLENILGLLLDKKDERDDGTYGVIKRVGFNQAITQQGKKSLTLNREKLAKLIHNNAWPSSTWENQAEIVKERYYKRTDSIIQSLPHLLEVSNEQ